MQPTRCASLAPRTAHALRTSLAAAALIAGAPPSHAAAPQLLPTGQLLTPTAAPGARFTALDPHLPNAPGYRVGQTVSEALSPDRRTLLVLTSGYNRRVDAEGRRIAAESHEYVFVFDIGGGAARETQVIEVPNTYVGIAFARSGDRFVVSGGGDDSVHVFERSKERWIESAASPIALGHGAGIGIKQKPLAQGVALTEDGTRAVVANRYNASVSLVDLASGRVLADIDLRPDRGAGGAAAAAGGEYPDAVQVAGNRMAFVSSEREREIVVVDLEARAVSARIPVSGNPNKLILNRNGSRLYAALDNADALAVIDARRGALLEEVPTVAPEGLLRLPKRYRGASPNALALSPDELTLYVTNRGTNSVAVLDQRDGHWRVRGLIPTGWYPSDVAVGPRGMLYVVNTQSVPGPNTGYCLGYDSVPCRVTSTPVRYAPNEYILSLAKGGLLSLPIPSPQALSVLTRRVALNNHFAAADADAALMQALHERIRHVIYIIKENRTYDQVLGDLGRGNGDPSLTEFPAATTPNLHHLASRFVLLDNFYDAGNVSGNGWPWSISGRESDAGAKMLPVNYAERGGSYDWEGTNSNVNVGLTGEARAAAEPRAADPALLPGTGNIAAPDGPDGERQQGYLWSAALRAGLAVRNYGFLIDLERYDRALLDSPATAPLFIALERDPAAKHLTVAYAADPELAGRTDGFYRGFDTAYPDTYREREWEREFAAFAADGSLPALSLVRLMADHTGSYGEAIDGVNTPERQVADNDFAVGRLIEAVAHSRYAGDTLIFIVEDDAQDGPDHVDAHRSTAYVVGPYVKHGALLSRHYSTLNLLRTLTDVLGIDHLSLFDAAERPMAEVFDLAQREWSYTAEVSGLLMAPDVSLPIPAGTKVAGPVRGPTHPAGYWAERTAGMDFRSEDQLDAPLYNRLLWSGLMGARRYPRTPAGTTGAGDD